MTVWTRVAAASAGLGTAMWMLAGAAQAQENFDAGKSGAELYASDCAICHKSARALNKSGGGLFGLESFLREHYTSSRESAAAIAAYLKTVGAPPDHRPAKKRRRGEKKNESKPRDGKPPEKPSEMKPGTKENGKAAVLAPVAPLG